MMEVAKNKHITYWIHSIITIFLMFAFGYVFPATGQITELGMQVIGVFLGLLYGWTFVGFLWPSLMAFIAIGLTDATTVTAALTAGFGANLTLVLVFIFIFAKYLEDSGLNEYLAYWFISRKIAIGRPWIFTGLLLMCALFLGLATNLFASIIVCWNVFYKIAELMKLEKKSKYVAVVLFGVVVAATFGSMAVPFQAVPLASINLYEKVTNSGVNFLTYSGFCVTMSIILIIMYLILCRIFFRPDVSMLITNGDILEEYRHKKMNQEIKTAGILLITFLILVFLPNVLPASWKITYILAKIGLIGDIIICLLVLLIVKKQNGESIIDFASLAAKGLNWDIIILIACTTPVCNALESSEAGILHAFLGWATPIMGSLAPYGILAFITICILLLTQIAHNMILCIIFVPLLAPMVAQFGVDPMVALLAIMFGAHVAYLTPAASTQVAMVYGNSEWVEKKHVLILAIIYVIFIVIFYLTVLIPCLMNFI